MPTDTATPTTDVDADERISLWGRYRRRRFRRRSFFWRWRRLLFLVMLVLVAALAGTAMVLTNIELPPQTDRLRETSFICTREVTRNCNEDNAAARLSGEENRVVVPYRRIPRLLINAVVAAEDQNFWEHNGIDPAGIARAGWAQIRGSSESQQGGSTITQQYVKTVYLTRERTLARKIREAIYAVELERELSKQEILERYLNTVYFGRGAYGVQAASQAYFFKDVQDLTLHQAAYLAGLIRAPETADADRNPEEATRRRNTTLANMLDLEYITEAQHDAASAIEWVPNAFGVCVDDAGNVIDCDLVPGFVLARTQAPLFSRVRGHDVGAEYYYEAVRQQLVEMFGEDRVYGGGLRVYTALDLAWQEQAYNTVRDRFPQPGPESSIVAVGPNGRVRAMMGGRDFNVSELNLAMGKDGGGSGRQPGSSFKPFALAEAIAQGYSAEARMPAPSAITLEIPNGGGDWNVSGGGASGGHTLLSATENSSNVVYAQLMLELGAENVIDMAHTLGVESELPMVPSIVLGAGEVSVLDMASAYATLRDHGLHHDPVLIERVEDSRGNVIFSANDRQPEQVISAQVADTVTTALRDVVTSGTGTQAALSDWSVAGKTGTTQNDKDAWFVGYTCKVSTAVWVGNVGGPGQEIAPLGGQGGTLAAPTWNDFMQRLIDNGLMENDDGCDLADVTEFPGRTEFEDLEVEDTSTTSSCPSGYYPSDQDGDGVAESCVEDTNTVPTPTTPQPTTPPPTTPPTTPPPTTGPPPTTTPGGPAPPGPGNTPGGFRRRGG
jgi:penicillin-binding protein 1A